MQLIPIILFFSLLLALPLSSARAIEVNYWPFFVGEKDEETDTFQSWQSIGPIVFKGEDAVHQLRGVRPLYISLHDEARDRGSWHLLYPVFNSRYSPDMRSWDILNLIRYQTFEPENGNPERSFRAFPIIFWGEGPQPEDSYFGIFPIAGHAQNFIFYDDAQWFLFPIWARLQRKETTTYAAPWPFIRVVRGPDTRGFHLWPLYGNVEKEGTSHHRYWLWPLGYRVERELWKEEPFEAFGFLPFYSSSTSERAISRTFIWPFFGFTESRDPEYSEKRYFWPLFVQRRGESYINRNAPFYTRSIRKGVDKKWIAWPFYKQMSWDERELLNERTQFLYFLYWSNVQSSIGNPNLEPAVKQHAWPFYSYWSDGAGTTQFQALSPFEVFFPFNDPVRENYSPLFALYRYESDKNDRTRHSLLFNFITKTDDPKAERFQLNIGPLFGYAREKQQKQWEFLKGFLSWDRSDEKRSFGFLWFNRPDPIGDSQKKPLGEEMKNE